MADDAVVEFEASGKAIAAIGLPCESRGV